jgi:hypothetical protein
MRQMTVVETSPRLEGVTPDPFIAALDETPGHVEAALPWPPRASHASAALDGAKA